jgi:hypothetical protein
MEDLFIKVTFGSYDTIINKPIYFLNYRNEFLNIYKILLEKYPDEIMFYELENEKMYIYSEIETIEHGWLKNKISYEIVEYCVLTLIPINNDIYKNDFIN